MSGLGVALGTFFSSTAGAAAVVGLAGSVISGVGSAIAERSAAKREKQDKIDEEKRLEARYAGAGAAARISAQVGDPTTATSLTQQRVRGQKDPATPLGFRSAAQAVGNQPPALKATTGGRRPRYDRNQAKIVFA